MDAKQLANEIRRVIKNELDDADRHLRNGDPDRARRELDDGMTKLKRLADAVARLS
jgi:hypothetical protein